MDEGRRTGAGYIFRVGHLRPAWVVKSLRVQFKDKKLDGQSEVWDHPTTPTLRFGYIAHAGLARVASCECLRDYNGGHLKDTPSPMTGHQSGKTTYLLERLMETSTRKGALIFEVNSAKPSHFATRIPQFRPIAVF